MGDVMGDINARRGQIAGTDIRNGAAIVTANVPLASMFGYATDLRSKTQGRATYSMEPSHFVELPKISSGEDHPRQQLTCATRHNVPYKRVSHRH